MLDEGFKIRLITGVSGHSSFAVDLQARLDQATALLASLQSATKKPKKQVTMQVPPTSASSGDKPAGTAMSGAGRNS